MRDFFNLFIVSILLVLLVSCSFVDSNSSVNTSTPIRDTVMTEGMIIKINNKNCLSLTVEAGKGLERSFSWNGGTRSIELIPRISKWYGTFGAYYPGIGNHWKIHDGVTRAIVEEAVINYKSYDQLLCALSNNNMQCKEKYYLYKDGNFDFKETLPSSLQSDECSAYTKDGLYISVGKGKGPGDGGTMYVTIYKIKVNGNSVIDLPGSSSDRITTRGDGGTH